MGEQHLRRQELYLISIVKYMSDAGSFYRRKYLPIIGKILFVKSIILAKLTEMCIRAEIYIALTVAFLCEERRRCARCGAGKTSARAAAQPTHRHHLHVFDDSKRIRRAEMQA